MDNNLTKDCIEAVYNQNEHFIVIGLTGRCGSGCSTTRDILCDGTFNPKLLVPNKNSEKTNELRDIKTLVHFAQSNHIFPFSVIKVRDILTSYILDDMDAFFGALKSLYPDINHEDKFDASISKYYQDQFGQDIEIELVSSKSKDIWRNLDSDIYTYLNHMTSSEYNFLFIELGRVSEAIRNYLRSIDTEAYTILYQYVGNVVRTYGQLAADITCINQKAKNIYSVAKRVNTLIKILRRSEWILNENKEEPVFKSDVRVVIDSVKNVFESNYLKARYHSYYLMAVTLDDEERRYRLSDNKGLSDAQIELIDLREQPSRAKKELNDDLSVYKNDLAKFDYNNIQADSFGNGTYIFNLQDVDACIQSADILVNNKGTTEDLKRYILRYGCLMFHPGLIPPTVDERCMQIAQAAKVNSGCISRQVGAVVCDSNNNIVSTGWNDPSSTFDNECISCIRRTLRDLCARDDTHAYSFYEMYDKEFRDHIRSILLREISQKCTIPEKLHSAPLSKIYKEYEKKYVKEIDGLPTTYCFKDIYNSLIKEKNQVHTRSQHGEERAFENCEKSKTTGGTLYTTSSSCELCAKKALSYSIKRIVYIEPYSGITNDHILGHLVSNGVAKNRRVDNEQKLTTEPMQIELFTGATQKAYAQLYTPIFPMKDELELRGVRIK